MAILKCKMCGGDIVLNEEKTFYTCESCGTSMTLPKVSDEQRAALFNRGNHFRRIGEFDKALAIYENIVREDDTDAEAHWCCVLCRFGIEYVEDPNTFEYLPTCHRASFDSILEDVDYLAALEHSDGITKKQYQKEAIKISEVQKGILATSQNEEPYDVFICYKETDDNTKERTRDSVDAQEIYYQLTQEGYRVFFSRVTLEDKVGTEYEPYIFAALNSAKVMIVVGSKQEFFNSVWVKNEWSRFISLMKKDRSKLLLPCYKEMDPYDLPEQLSVLQSYDMTKIGFIQDLTRGIKKVISTEEINKNTAAEEDNVNIEPLLKRAFIFLEDGNWTEADAYCEKVLDQDPENEQAYLGKLMAELHVSQQEDFKDCRQPFNNSINYKKVIRFGGDEIGGMLSGYIDYINERNENMRLSNIYDNAVTVVQSANSESSYKEAAEIFKMIPGFKDADLLAKQCLERAAQCLEKTELEKKKALSIAHTLTEGDKKIDNLIWIQDIQRELEVVDLQEKQLSEQRSRLGIFAGKEKKRIDEETIAVLEQKNALTSQISKLLEEQNGIYPADLERDSNEMINKVANLKVQIQSARAQTYGEYIYDEALNIYLNEPDMTVAVNSIYQAEIISPLKSGRKETICFGRYFLEEKGSPEPIEWQVLAQENGCTLVISKYVLDCKSYNTSRTDITWENCSLRKWLNETFFREAFNSVEQNMIQTTTATTDKNLEYLPTSDKNETDKVFALSINEANKYFTSDDARICCGTAYCDAKGFKDHGSIWWLRSRSRLLDKSAATVDENGDVHDSGVYIDVKLGVRPALWINLGL